MVRRTLFAFLRTKGASGNPYARQSKGLYYVRSHGGTRIRRRCQADIPNSKPTYDICRSIFPLVNKVTKILTLSHFSASRRGATCSIARHIDLTSAIAACFFNSIGKNKNQDMNLKVETATPARRSKGARSRHTRSPGSVTCVVDG